MHRVLRIRDALRVRVWHLRVKRQRRYRVAVGGIEVHVFRESVCVEEIIARPSIGQIGQIRRIKIHGDFVARTVDHIFFVRLAHQIRHVAVARIVSGLPRIRSGRAHFFIDIAQIVDRFSFHNARVAAKP